MTFFDSLAEKMHIIFSVYQFHYRLLNAVEVIFITGIVLFLLAKYAGFIFSPLGRLLLKTNRQLFLIAAITAAILLQRIFPGAPLISLYFLAVLLLMSRLIMIQYVNLPQRFKDIASSFGDKPNTGASILLKGFIAKEILPIFRKAYWDILIIYFILEYFTLKEASLLGYFRIVMKKADWFLSILPAILIVLIFGIIYYMIVMLSGSKYSEGKNYE
jgi:hypothetical protein